jgi:hypothetical protein
MAGTLFRELAEIVRLEKGRHRTPQDGVCTMELVAWMAGEKHSDHPKSASPVIAAFIRSFNDALDSAHRQRLAALAARMIDTRGSREDEAQRRQILWDWMIAVALPTWLAAANRPDLAASVAAGRAGALEAAIAAMDAYGHAIVRPVDDHRTAEAVSGALGTAGITGACLAGRDAADAVIGPRARRHWEAARVLARTAVWSIAESEPDPGGPADHSAVWRTAYLLRDSAFVVLDRLIGVTAPPPPPPPPPPMLDGADRPERTESAAV